MKEPDTRVWCKERGVIQRPEAVLLYSPNVVILSKLKGVLHLHQLRYSEPSPNAILICAETKLLGPAVTQWRESLSGTQYAEICGALFESRTPSVEELARAPMHLEELDQVLARMHTNWLVKLFASLYVVFQSLISVATRSCVAYECLVRGSRLNKTPC
jgi:hypothetical protein